MSNTSYNFSPHRSAYQTTESSTALPEALIEASRSRGRFLAALTLGTILAATPAQIPSTNPLSRRRDELEATTGSSGAFVDPLLVLRVKELFEAGASEFFQDGTESAFSRSLLYLIDRHGGIGLTAIAQYLFEGQGKPEVASEALRWLADNGGPETLPIRWAALRRGLKNSSPVVRDGAVLGFASLDDPRAQAVLSEARDVEQVRALQRLTEHVIARLGRNR